MQWQFSHVWEKLKSEKNTKNTINYSLLAQLV